MQTKNQIAKCSATGLFFNGVAFEEINASNATRFSEATTPADFKLMGWLAPVSKAGKSHKSYSIRIADGKYVSRKINVPKTSRPGESEAWISLYGGQNVLIWSKGELATDWA